MSARVITFKALLERTAGRIGLTVDYAAGSLFLQNAPTLAQYLSDASRKAWQAYAWPESLTEQDLVTPTNGYLIPWETVGSGSYAEIWSLNPLTAGNARKLGFTNNVNGLVINFGDRPPSGGTVFLRFRGDAPVYSYTTLTGTETAGDIAYNTADGNCYGALVNSPGTDVTNSAKWALQPVLLILAQALQALAHSDWLLAAGQAEAAVGGDGEGGVRAAALDQLDDEWGDLIKGDPNFSRRGRR